MQVFHLFTMAPGEIYLSFYFFIFLTNTNKVNSLYDSWMNTLLGRNRGERMREERRARERKMARKDLIPFIDLLFTPG